MDKLIPLNKGIHRQPSVGTDGELSELVNLIPQNGELVNVRGLKEIGIKPIEGYVFMAVHHIGEDVKYIFSKDDELLSVYKTTEGEQLNDAYTLGSKIKEVFVFGNTLIVSCAKSIQYMLYRDGKYVDLGDALKYIPFEFAIYRKFDTGDVEGFDANEYNIATKAGECAEAFINEKSKDGYIAPFFVRTCIELYDESLICISSPVLMLPATKYEAVVLQYSNSRPGDDPRWFAQQAVGYVHQLGYRCYDDRFSNAIKLYGDIVKSVNIYISKPLRLFGDNATECKIVENHDFGFSYAGGVDWIGGALISNFDRRSISEDFGNASIEGTAWVQYRDDEDIVLDMEKEMPFYLLTKIKVGEISEKFVKLDYDPSVIERVKPDLDMELTVTGDITASSLYAYNNRLIVSNTREKLFRGYPVRTIFPSGNASTDDKAENQIYFHINREGRDIIVRGDVDMLDNNIPYRYLFYPDINAYKATIVYNGEAFSFPLKPNTFINGAYYFNGFDKSMLTADHLTNEIPDYDERKGEIINRNTLYYTNANNPFVLSIVRSVAVGAGEILGMSTSAKALSQGQFGQFPLYVFCTDGIWALEVASDGAFSAKQPISRDVCNNPDSITQIDGAVVFTTDQGLMMIQGSEVVNLSGAMEGFNVDESEYFKTTTDGKKFFESYGKEGFDDLVISETKDFREILRDCTIAYDYVNKMLRIFPTVDNFKGKYYVFSLESREFATVYLGAGNPVTTVVPDYPSSIVQIGQALYRPSERDDDKNTKKGLLLTRPITLDEPFALKKLQDVRLHYSKFDGKSKCHVIVYVSNDGTNWAIMKSLRKRSYKYYRFAIITDMKDMDALSGMVLRYEVERNNKLR